MMTLITGFTCPPTIYFKFITKCDSFFYYKVRQLFYYKVRQVLLQSATGITRCDNFITKCDGTDLPYCLEYCQVVMNADDTMIYFSANCCQNIEYHQNADLANLAEWFNNNYLTLNTSKSKFVLFGGDRRLQTCEGVKLVIDQENLECEDSIKYLGVACHS